MIFWWFWMELMILNRIDGFSSFWWFTLSLSVFMKHYQFAMNVFWWTSLSKINVFGWFTFGVWKICVVMICAQLYKSIVFDDSYWVYPFWSITPVFLLLVSVINYRNHCYCYYHWLSGYFYRCIFYLWFCSTLLCKA